MNTLVTVTVAGEPVMAQVTQAQVREALEVSGFKLTTEGPSVVPGEERWEPTGGDGSTWSILNTIPQAPSVVEWSLRFAVEELARFHDVTPGAMLREIAGAVIGEWTEEIGTAGGTWWTLSCADGARAAQVGGDGTWHAFSRDCYIIGSGERVEVDAAKRLARAALVGRKLAPEKTQRQPMLALRCEPSIPAAALAHASGKP